MPIDIGATFYVGQEVLQNKAGITKEWLNKELDQGVVLLRVTKQTGSYEYECSTPSGKTVLMTRAELIKKSQAQLTSIQTAPDVQHEPPKSRKRGRPKGSSNRGPGKRKKVVLFMQDLMPQPRPKQDEAPPEGNDQAAEPSEPSPPQPSPPSMPNNEGVDIEEESGEEESENDGENDDEHGANAGMPLETFRAGLSHTKSVRSKTRSNPMCGVCRGCRTAYRCTDCNLAICAWATGRDCQLHHMLTQIDGQAWLQARQAIGQDEFHDTYAFQSQLTQNQAEDED